MTARGGFMDNSPKQEYKKLIGEALIEISGQLPPTKVEGLQFQEEEQ